MKFQAVKGTRDFYPEEMRLRNWIIDTWRDVSLRNGFEEYDAPIFEYLELFTVKSGDEIAEQLFNLTDRGGRNLAIRPEITPSLARMVAGKISSLPRPIKWFSIPRLCRAENPQRGRLREFFQWNVDIIGEDSVQADAECIFTAVDFLQAVHLSPDEVCVRIGSRPLTVAALRAGGVETDQVDAALALLDKRPKIKEEVFPEMIAEAGLGEAQLALACELQDCSGLDEIRATIVKFDDPTLIEHVDKLGNLMQLLEQMGIADFCRLDLRIVRGLAYYTGVVYEVFDRKQSLRAVAGGGRYDKLLEVVGGPPVSATGFGMGDVVLAILLEQKGKVPETLKAGSLDYFVIDDTDNGFHDVLRVVAAVRRAGFAADYSYKRQNVGKQLKEANRRGAMRAAFVRNGQVAVKDLQSGEQGEDQPIDTFLNTLQPTGR